MYQWSEMIKRAGKPPEAVDSAVERLQANWVAYMGPWFLGLVTLTFMLFPVFFYLWMTASLGTSLGLAATLARDPFNAPMIAKTSMDRHGLSPASPRLTKLFSAFRARYQRRTGFRFAGLEAANGNRGQGDTKKGIAILATIPEPPTVVKRSTNIPLERVSIRLNSKNTEFRGDPQRRSRLSDDGSHPRSQEGVTPMKTFDEIEASLFVPRVDSAWHGRLKNDIFRWMDGSFTSSIALQKPTETEDSEDGVVGRNKPHKKPAESSHNNPKELSSIEENVTNLTSPTVSAEEEAEYPRFIDQYENLTNDTEKAVAEQEDVQLYNDRVQLTNRGVEEDVDRLDLEHNDRAAKAQTEKYYSTYAKSVWEIVEEQPLPDL
ncbi:hypothetical protein M407DRAFT_234456 [Tulasnella calospora MUT 4182]|uniref:Uncharacterized protein n=1 Tax=Tulasnella calospora MUT 4182 TaxID=1051891 RepID=A0A0C3QUX8_9AGAM|nr:hypothetical protein M407DRAFT_234456 [Tulasnella calospora MUT 4182]